MEEDWANTKVFVQFLKTFYEVTLKFSASKHVTSNTFFHEICSIQRQLSELCESSDCLLSTMAFGMRRKFEKYWGNKENINCMLFIAVVLDLRYKRDYLRYCFSMVYDATTASKLCKKVDDTLSSLMSFYGKGVDNEKNREMAANTPKERPVQAVNELLSQFLKQRGANMEKNDLDRYLADENVNPLTPDFDILEWWKDNSKKFKVLSQIARDVLAVQVSTVASESAFSTGGRILDPFRSSLNPKMVEALVCTQNWLKSTHDSMQVRDYLDDLKTYENLDNSTSCPTTTIEEHMSVD
ncbi:zinc finger BED domain-containing protein RICESLEEPER 2-like [Morus notabilis]|uniref:zinc finger BED domain-containing protein RICESLEEPER 2-like n=1 Tax=Morus notabilis TaxID=981085 RepID=UPI000CED41FD|nr:zinc finger BED domain-containing protein RICESLEEPER 2-like [Morus notabilis]